MEKIKSEIQQQVIFQDEGFRFEMEYEHANCSFEILLNGIPVVTHFVPNSIYIKAQLNPMILTHGKQMVTIRMFPSKKNLTDFAQSLDSTSMVMFKIIKDKRSSDPMWAWSEEAKNTSWAIVSYSTPRINKETSYAEYTIDFVLSQEDVNWSLRGWTDSEYLRSTDKLKSEVNAFYKHLSDVIDKKDTPEYIRLRKQQIIEEVNSCPFEKTGVEDLIESLSESINMVQENLFLLNDSVEMKFYAENRVISLVCTDPKFFGYPPLISQGKQDKYASSFTIYLHKPKGSNKLEIIR